MRFNKIFLSTAAFVVLTTATAFSAYGIPIFGIRADSSSANGNVIGLVSFDSSTPGVVVPIGAFSNVVAGQTVRSIDFRPSTGQLYAVSVAPGGTAGQLYTVNIATAALTPVGSGFTLGASGVGNGSTQDLVEIDFNPITDQIRLVTGANLNALLNPVPNNYRLDPATGALLATDTNFNYVPGDPNAGLANMQMDAIAYANPAGGKTTVYGWDWATDSVVRLGGIGGDTPNTPSSGRLFTIFKPPTFITSTNGSGVGMDVGPNGVLYLTRESGSAAAMGLFTVNASTGAQTLVGNYPAATPFITDIAVQRLTTAAGVTVSGRLAVAGGVSDTSKGLANAAVVLTDAAGNSRTTTSGRGGTFAFDDVEVGRTYTLSVQSKGYSFDPQVVTVMDSMSNITLNGTAVTRGH
jgi:hypothetical protein